MANDDGRRVLAIIHTTPVTVEPLKALARELMPGVDVLNWVDDSILPELARNGGNLEAVAPRWLHYVRFAEAAGAHGILNACSSVGPLTERAKAGVPVVRIDAAMAEDAVRAGTRIGVAATLPTTLKPTVALLRATAARAGRTVEVMPHLVEGAFDRLSAGDRDGHDALVRAVLTELAAACDVVVLAQASMARVAATLPEEHAAKCRTSPRPAMERVKRLLEGKAA